MIACLSTQPKKTLEHDHVEIPTLLIQQSLFNNNFNLT